MHNLFLKSLGFVISYSTKYMKCWLTDYMKSFEGPAVYNPGQSFNGKTEN